MKIQAKDAKTILSKFKASEEACALSRTESPPLSFLNSLITMGLFVDACHFLAHALPKREAAWWAYICAEQAEKKHPNPLCQQALEKIKQWVYQPTDENRRAVQIFTEKLGFDTASAWAANAVFWSGGSITAPENPDVMPPENLSAHAVAGTVMLAATLYRPEGAVANYQHFLAQGINIAENGHGEI